jgi:DNA-binding NarL/FixJ family response regulator
MYGDSVTLDQLLKPDGPTVQAGPRVLIVIDRRALAELLSGALEAAGMRVLGTAQSAAQAVSMAEGPLPDVVVMEAEMPGQDGLAATRRLRALAPNAAVAVLTARPEQDWITRLAEAGASAAIPTNCSLTQLIDVLSRLSRTRPEAGPGPMLIAPSMFAGPPTLASSLPSDAMGLRLTRRELELLRCLGEAMPVKAIAQNLGITLNTCRSYVKSLHSKLNSSSTLEAVLRAQSLGLLP